MQRSGPAIQYVLLPVCVILLIQTAASHALSIPEPHLTLPQLRKVPLQLGPWKASGEQSLEAAVTEYLTPDDYILRDYVDKRHGAPVSLFVAYFKSLQNVYGPHSPRICLPGSGWLVRESKIVSVAVPGRGEAIPVNEYLMEKSDAHILVVYWYQDQRHAWAEEFQAKLTLLPSLLRYRRSDASLIRLITPVGAEMPGQAAARCIEFTHLLYPSLMERFAAAR